MIEISRTQDEEVGDGTTSVIILGKLSKLLLNPKRLLINIDLMSGVVPPSLAMVLFLE